MKKKITLLKIRVAMYRYCWIVLFMIPVFLSSGIRADGQAFDWANQVAGSASWAYGIAMDAEGNNYVTGYFTGIATFSPTVQLIAIGAGENAFLAKYDGAGNCQWARRIMTGSNMGAVGRSVTADKNGGVYITGYFDGTSYFDAGSGTDSLVALGDNDNIFLAKYNDNGDLVWTKGMPGEGVGEGFECVADRSGNVYIAGYFQGAVNFDPAGTTAGSITSVSQSSANQSNLFIAKYSPDGTYIWARGVGGTGHAQAYGIAVDTSGAEDKLCLKGVFSDTIDFDPGNGIANLFSGGDTIESSFIAKYDTSGAYIWSKGMLSDIANNFSDEAGGIAVDTQGNILVTGGFAGNMDFDPGPGTALLSANGIINMYLAKYDQDGNYQWGIATEGQGPGSLSGGNGLSLDQTGNAYVTGTTGITAVDFDPSEDTAYLVPSTLGLYNIFIAKYGTCGNYLSAVSLAGTLIGSGEGIVLNTAGDACITGMFAGNVDFDPGPGVNSLSAASYQAYVAKYHYDADSIPTNHLTVTTCQDSFVLNGQTYTASGTYQQLLPATVQCDSLIILDLTLSAQVATPVITVNGFVLGLTNSYATYQWLENGSPVAGATAPTYTVTENGNYQVAVTNEEGCNDTSEIYTVTNATGVEDIQKLAAQISAYPNPAQDVIYIKSPVKVGVALTSVDGRVIITATDATTLNVEGIADGLYFLRLSGKDNRLLKIIKIVKRSK